MSTFLQNTQKLIDEATKIAGVSDAMKNSLETPEKGLEFKIPVKMDNGLEQNFQAWRVQHNSALGPYKGGLRFHPDSNLDEVSALASLMTWKTSLAGIPYGGGKGAIKVDPKKLSKRELEELSRGYVRGLWQNIGPQKDIPAPDVNTNSEIMDWMTDEYTKLSGKSGLATFTGKSVEKGGSRGREIATGFGGFVILREYLNLNPNAYNLKPSVAIQGFGNVGSNIAKLLYENDFKIIAISDSKGALYEKEGIDISKVIDIKEKTGIIQRNLCYGIADHNNEPCKQLTNEELLELPVDILIPAALESVITEKNADKIQAKVILELANGPITAEADAILSKKEIEVIPDILANAGGVVGSYFEWMQNLKGESWGEGEVLEKIDDQLVAAFQEVVKTKGKYPNISWRMASFVRAIERVADATRDGG